MRLSSNLLICRDADAVAQEAAERFACAAVSSVAEKGAFYVAIPGGWSPRGMFRTLATGAFAAIIPWDRMHIFFTDERTVPPSHEDSNYKLANDLLLSRVPVVGANIHRFPAEFPPEVAARNYEDEVRRVMGDNPRFDLVVLGMGTDTHTASLYPHSPALHERERLAMANPVEKLGGFRLTLTIPVLCNAASIMILALGEGKAASLREVLEGEMRIEEHPVQAIRPANGRLLWIVDQAAASEL